ncbi:MAG TPA: hypothetical protein VGS97_09215 [Actinocrinis sp.]|uniref:hypothetical protein n=1 Tax=Actinocrinis sp. TaxID=1920516 RepID=UPI002DDCDEA7|nr:hypothetical protein [Actinocrinis sp.]HEV2344259.1 hypothetical protein [Actinocrinis sp.]
MATETEYKQGQCAQHGQVNASRELPALSFPFIVTKIQRTMAAKKTPFECPQCGKPVSVS